MIERSRRSCKTIPGAFTVREMERPIWHVNTHRAAHLTRFTVKAVRQLTDERKNQRRQEAARPSSLIIAECKIIQKQLTFLFRPFERCPAHVDENGHKVIVSLSGL